MIDGRRPYARRLRRRYALSARADDDALLADHLAVVLRGQDQRDAELDEGNAEQLFQIRYTRIRIGS